MNKRQENEKTLWNRVAKSYDRQTQVYAYAYEQSIHKALQHIEADSSVLEIGCGTGTITFGIAGQAKNVEAIDISERMIEVAGEKAKQNGITHIHFQVGDAYHLPYENESFDVILLFNILHVVKDCQTVLKEAYRLLKPGGKLLTATDCYAEKSSWTSQMKILVEKLLKRLGLIPYLSIFSKHDLERMLKNHGFELFEKDVLHYHPVNYYLAGRKVV
mgnify:FL=1